MFHHNWVKTTGRVLDSRIRAIYHDHPDGELGGSGLPLHNYIVEFQAPSGETTKLEIEQHIETVDVGIGSAVPLLVSPDGKKAVFDQNDPSINVIAVNEATEAADRERFRKDLIRGT